MIIFSVRPYLNLQGTLRAVPVLTELAQKTWETVKHFVKALIISLNRIHFFTNAEMVCFILGRLVKPEIQIPNPCWASISSYRYMTHLVKSCFITQNTGLWWEQKKKLYITNLYLRMRSWAFLCHAFGRELCLFSFLGFFATAASEYLKAAPLLSHSDWPAEYFTRASSPFLSFFLFWINCPPHATVIMDIVNRIAW